ncbi:MAG: hypothetical protein QN135_06545 [Armatimonadota bacterium]|nr:hypothetical protein [Armatimonadota bacterium]
MGIEDPDRLAEDVMRLTGGNPLFVVETMKTLFEAGALGGEVPRRIPLPQRVGAVIRQCLDRLSEDARQLARVMAVAGPEFTEALAATALRFNETRLADAVAELEAAQITRRGRFTHDLLMEAVLASAPAAASAALNRAVASHLEGPPADPARIAHHWEAGGHPQRALAWLVRAAEAAVARGARQQAAEWLERVVAQAPDASEPGRGDVAPGTDPRLEGRSARGPSSGGRLRSRRCATTPL